MADNMEGLGTMLSFLGQGSNAGGADPLPDQSPPAGFFQQSQPAQAPQPGGSGVLKGIIGNLASSYISNKLQTHMDKQAAKETASAYGPIVQDLAKNATNDQDKEQYGTFAKLINSNNPTLVNQGLTGVQNKIKQASELTVEQRNWNDPTQRTRMQQEDIYKSMPQIAREMAVMYPALQPGSPEYANQAMLLKRSGAMNVNVGAPKSWIMPTDAEKMVNAQGQHPSVGTEWGSPEAKGYTVATTTNQADIKQGGIAANFTNELNNLLFKPKTGLYANYGNETTENKVKQTVIQNYQKYAQTDPRYKQADDYIQSNLAPMVRSLGTVGNLSDTDLERASGLLPVVTGVNIDTPTVARGKMERFNKVISAANQVNPITGKINGITPEILNNIGEVKPKGWTDKDEEDYQALLKSRQQ